MKFIERIRECIKDSHILNGEEKYYVKSYDLLEYLKENEVDIPNKYVKMDKYFGTGALQYMEELTGREMDYFIGDNTYNWSGKIDFDLDFRSWEGNDDNYYVAIQVHLGGDIRGNYSDFCLLKFDCEDDFYETIENFTNENCYFEYEFKGYTFYIVPSIFSEYLYVECMELDLQTDGTIWASTDEDLEEQLDKWLTDNEEEIELNKIIKEQEDKVLEELVIPNPFHYNAVRRQGGLDIEIYNTQIPDLKASTTTMLKGEYVQKYFDIDKLWQVNVVNEQGKFEKHIYIEGWQNVIKQLKENKKKVNKK